MSSIIDRLLQHANPDEREINLKGQALNNAQVSKLVLLVAHAGCPAFALNLEDATAPTMGHVLANAFTHKPLTELNLRNFKLVRAEAPECISHDHLELIARLLGPGGKLQSLILDGQNLLPRGDAGAQTFDANKKVFKALLVAVRASTIMKTLSLRGCELFHEDLFILGEKLYPHDNPCTLTTLALSNNFREGSPNAPAHCVKRFLSSAARSRCLESLDLVSSVECIGLLDDELLQLVVAVKTLCDLSETNVPLGVQQQLEANRQARIASATAMVICAWQHNMPAELGRVVSQLIFDAERAKAAEPV